MCVSHSKHKKMPFFIKALITQEKGNNKNSDTVIYDLLV